MDALRNLFGNVTATLLRLVLVVGTIAAVSVFIVKPTLDTTEHLSNQGFEQQRQVQSGIQRDIQKRIRETTRRVQQSINQSLRQSRRTGGPTPRQLRRCVQRARGDVERIQACARKF